MPEFHHIPVLLDEVLAALRPRAGGKFADGTVGGAGHASAILRATAPDGWLFGCDRDGAAIERALEVLREFGGRFELRHGRYTELGDWVPEGSCDGVLLDLGVSSPQLDRPERGFSFMQDGPLDMRMDPRQALTAEALVNELSSRELADLIFELTGERHAFRMARAIERERARARIRTTGALAAVIERAVGRSGKTHPATRLFLALRMAVNDELGQIRGGLERLWRLLKPGGRLAVITFHSSEDRVVKEFGRRMSRDYVVEGDVDVPELRRPARPQLRWVNRKAIAPEEREWRANPRARSAQLRVLERI